MNLSEVKTQLSKRGWEETAKPYNMSHHGPSTCHYMHQFLPVTRLDDNSLGSMSEQSIQLGIKIWCTGDEVTSVELDLHKNVELNKILDITQESDVLSLLR